MARPPMIDLAPGPALDALVAGRVIGGNGCAWCERYPGAICASDHPPNYSTSITAAWEVVENRLGPQFDVIVRKFRGTVLYDVKVLDVDGKEVAWAEGLSASHAICLAALKALGYAD